MACCDNNINYFAPRWSSFLDFVPTVPQLYWNVDGNEQRYHLLCKQLHKLVCYADMLGVKINIDHDAIEALEAEFEEFKASGFDDYYLAQIEQWINDNLETVFHLLIKQVYFGINDQGYFVAYVPESWSDIEFDTGMVYNRYDYGRLILRYDVDGSGVIDNTGRYDDANTDSIMERLALLENRVFRNENTLYTNLDR